MAQPLQTVSAYKSLLRENDYELKEIGLNFLLQHVALHWSDIANDIHEIETLLNDQNFPNQPLAAILLSKLYFNLNQYEEALKYALQSRQYFKIDDDSEFTEVLINRCIKDYIELSKQRRKNPSIREKQQYKDIVTQIIRKSISKGEYKLPLGVALQTQDIKLVQEILTLMHYHELVEFVLPHVDGMDLKWRKNLLAEITAFRVDGKIVAGSPYQYINLLIIAKYVDDFNTVSALIYESVKERQFQLAYTLALQVSEMHGFSEKVEAALPIEASLQKQLKILKFILRGEFKDQVFNVYLKNFARTDPHYLNQLKAVDPKNSVAHSSALLSLSMLQAFTQDDSFIKIKQNFEWAAKSTHWAKFSSIASLGLIHRNTKNMDTFKQFLPESNKPNVVNHYPNGGALYGLGLLYTGSKDQTVQAYYTNIATNPDHSQNEVVMHGTCLGLGLTAFASCNEAIAQKLKDYLSISNSVVGQAAALAIGLIYAGSNNEAIIADLMNVADETDHEKIIRSVCLSLAIIGFQNPSPELLENLQKNANLKIAVPQYIASAYFKTSNQQAVRKLLHISNDISNQVKRSAITSLGFVLYHDEHLTSLLKTMIYSYNPFIRYGCAMALMVGAKDSKEAIQLIWPLLTDTVDYVRQAAYISIAILLQVTNANSEPKLTEFRKIINEVLAKKHEQTLARMGALLAVGLIDVAGRNMCVSLTTRSGIPKIEAIVGMLVFLNFWNWFPYVNFIGLTLTPSAFIGITADLKIPKSFELKSNCKASLFDYPPNIVKEQKKDVGKRESKVQLSTTIKVKARAQNKKKESEMEIEGGPGLVQQPSLISQVSNAEIKEVKEEDNKQQKPKQEVEAEKKEELFTILKNPVRVAEKQRKYISFVEGRYVPILPQRKIGISFLKDTSPEQPDECFEICLKDDTQAVISTIPEGGERVNPNAVPVSSNNGMPQEFEFTEADEQNLNEKSSK